MLLVLFINKLCLNRQIYNRTLARSITTLRLYFKRNYFNQIFNKSFFPWRASNGLFILTASDIAVKIKIHNFLKDSYNGALHDIIMPNIMLSRNVLMGFLPIVFMVAAGCEGLQKPGEFVESLRTLHLFQRYYLPEIKNIDDIVNEKGLAEGENVKIIPIGKDKSSVYTFSKSGKMLRWMPIIISYMMR